MKKTIHRTATSYSLISRFKNQCCCDAHQRCSSHLRYRRVLAEVEVTAEIAVVADDLWQDVGVAGVTELGFLGKLSDVHETQEVSLQLVHLVRHVGVQ